MTTVTAIDFLSSKGYTKSDLNQGAKNVLMLLNKHGIEIVKVVPVANGISFLVDKEKAEQKFSVKKSNGGEKSRTLHNQDRSLARAILAIANELGIELKNRQNILDIAEYSDSEVGDD